jgi:hypothetical protein
MQSYFLLGTTIALAGYHVTARYYTNRTNLWMYSNATSCILCENVLQIICQTHVFQLGFNFL